MSKIVVITGATRGIGLSIAKDLELDHTVISLGRKQKEIETPGEFIRCDITDSSDVENCVNGIIQNYGMIDVLINCAGVMLFNNLVSTTESEFDDSFAVNVKGTFLMMKEVLPFMREKKEGYIINLSSVRGITSAPTKGIYSATKVAVRSLTETVLLENKDNNIKATSICPGIVWTESTKEKLKNEGLGEKDVVLEEDITKTVRYLISLSSKAYVREIVIGGRLHG